MHCIPADLSQSWGATRIDIVKGVYSLTHPIARLSEA